MTDLSFPENLLEFDTRFPDEESCRAYFAAVRWPDGFRCPRCFRPGWRLNGRALFECQLGHQTSLTARTIFHSTRKPLRLWFRVMFLMAAQKQGLSAKNLMRLLGFRSFQTAWHWLHKLRRATVRRGRDRLFGVVEVDECLLEGKPKSAAHWGHPVVVGAVEHNASRLLVAHVLDSAYAAQYGGVFSAFPDLSDAGRFPPSGIRERLIARRR